MLWKNRMKGSPLFPQPTAGQFPAVSPLRHAPLKRDPPSVPAHWLHETSVKVPVSAPWPEGKNALDPPVSWQISKLRDIMVSVIRPDQFGAARRTGMVLRVGCSDCSSFGHTIPGRHQAKLGIFDDGPTTFPFTGLTVLLSAFI